MSVGWAIAGTVGTVEGCWLVWRGFPRWWHASTLPQRPATALARRRFFYTFIYGVIMLSASVVAFIMAFGGS